MRLRCPRCATLVDADPGTRIVCPSCGFTAGAPAAPAPAGAPIAAPPAPMTPPIFSPPGQPSMHPSLLNPNHGPIGKKRWPGTPVLLGLLTAGIYTFVWYWKISNEMDGFMQRPGAAHKRVRASLFLYLGAIVFLVLGMAGFIVSLGPDIMQDTEPLPEPAGPGLGVFILCILVAFGLLIAGFVLLLMGLWRVWKMMEEEDQRRLAPEPFNATVALVLALLVMVPWVGAILYFAALVITQKGLNRIWAAYRQPPMPTGF